MKNSARGSLGIRIVCMSDLHNIDPYYDFPDGDILIIVGDICEIGNETEIKEFDEFLALQNHSAKLVIAGNHDFLFEDYSPKTAKKLLKHAIYWKTMASTSMELRFGVRLGSLTLVDGLSICLVAQNWQQSGQMYQLTQMYLLPIHRPSEFLMSLMASTLAVEI